MKLNDWLTYSIVPGELNTILRPAMWGNGQLELSADINRPCVCDTACFGFGAEGLHYGPFSCRFGGEQHILPAVYDDETGRKYFLYLPESPDEHQYRVTLRPDRQTWHYEFDDLVIEVSLILPRLHPGYLFKLELFPKAGNMCRRWFVYQEVRDYGGITMRATEADFDLKGGRAWFKCSQAENPEAIGSTVDAAEVNLGLDGPWASHVMVKTMVESDRDAGAGTAYYARAFGDTIDRAREELNHLLSSPEKLEAETEAWWNQYLDAVPRLDVPDEDFARKFLWYWPNFRMNRIDIPIGKTPPGIHRDNYGSTSFKLHPMVVQGNLLVEAIQLLHDPQPARDSMLYWLRETRKEGLLLSGVIKGEEAPGNYVCVLIWFCGLLYRYVLTSGDFDLLNEDIGGITVLQRLEEATDAQLPFRDEKTGLFPVTDEITRFNESIRKKYGMEDDGKPSGPGNSSEGQTRFRGSAGTFYSDMNAEIYAGFLVLADLEGLAQNEERSARYRELADGMYDNIQRHLWNEEAGFFCDLKADGVISDYIGTAGFITGLFANPTHRQGGVATREQAEKLATWCNHPDFVSELGVLSLARSSPYFDPMNWKGRNGGFNFYPNSQIAAGLYAHGCYEEAHRQLFKQFRRIGDNAGLGPRWAGEAYHGYTGEILPWRNPNYTMNLPALAAITEGVFGLRWTIEALTVHVNSPWPWAKLSNIKIRKSLLDLELREDGTVTAVIDGKNVARNDEGRLELSWDMFVSQ